MTDYTVVRSDRKKIKLELSTKGLVVKAPYAATDEQIAQIVKEHAEWIAEHKAMIEEIKKGDPERWKRIEEQARRMEERNEQGRVGRKINERS